MEEEKKEKLEKPKLVDGFAQLVSMDQMFKEKTTILTDRWRLEFFTHKGEYFRTFVSDETVKNKKNMPSRKKQLGFGISINVGDFVSLTLAQIRAGVTYYTNKVGKELPYKEDRLEIRKICKVDEKFFNEKYKDFIAKFYFEEIKSQMKDGVSPENAISIYERILRNKKD